MNIPWNRPRREKSSSQSDCEGGQARRHFWIIQMSGYASLSVANNLSESMLEVARRCRKKICMYTIKRWVYMYLRVCARVLLRRARVCFVCFHLLRHHHLSRCPHAQTAQSQSSNQWDLPRTARPPPDTLPCVHSLTYSDAQPPRTHPLPSTPCIGDSEVIRTWHAPGRAQMTQRLRYHKNLRYLNKLDPMVP